MIKLIVNLVRISMEYTSKFCDKKSIKNHRKYSYVHMTLDSHLKLCVAINMKIQIMQFYLNL